LTVLGQEPAAVRYRVSRNGETGHRGNVAGVSACRSGLRQFVVIDCHADGHGRHTQELTKAEWIAKADAICAATKEETAPLKAEANALKEAPENASTYQKLAEVLKAGTASIPKETAALRALEPPSGDQEIIQKMIGTVEANATLGDSMADALENSDLERFEALNEQAKENTTKAKGLAQGYGLKVCGGDD
jgi:hypothetical protein